MTPHPSGLDVDTDEIRSEVLEMGARARAAVERSVRAVMRRDLPLARAVIVADKIMETGESEIDERCLRTLALYRPVGEDLRFLSMSMKITADLLSVGSLARRIADLALQLSQAPGVEPGEVLAEMGHEAAEMVQLSLDAFRKVDRGALVEIQARAENLSVLSTEARERWTASMRAHSDQVDRAMAYASVARHLERIGHSAIAICRHVQVIAGESRY